MKKIKIIGIVFCLLGVLLFINIAHADLFNRGTDILGNRMIYDSDLNLTWYDYTFDTARWQQQMIGVSNLTVNFAGTIYDDWRLPTTVDGPHVYGYDGTTTAGYNITSSEMGHLFYEELGNLGYYDTSGNYGGDGNWGLSNKGPFLNLQSYPPYWSGTEYTTDTDSAWHFVFNDGIQSIYPKASQIPSYSYYSAIAVRSGDVAVVPELVSSILFITGGVTLGFRRFWKKRGSV